MASAATTNSLTNESKINSAQHTYGASKISAINAASSIGNIINVPFETANAYNQAKTEAQNYRATASALRIERDRTLTQFDRETRQLAGQQTISYIMSGFSGATPETIKEATLYQRTTDYNAIRSNYDTQIKNAERAEKAAKKQGKNALFGGIAQTASSIGALAIFSDERLKENLTPVGKADNGLTIYIGNYTEESGLDDGKPHLFLIAQEVQKIRPDAVVETESGYLAVDYIKALL